MSPATSPAAAAASATPRVCLVIVTWECRAEVLQTLDALRALREPLEIAVVDNASSDGTPGAVRAAFPEVQMIECTTNLGFGAACNRGARVTRAPFLLFLNPDAEPRPGAIGTLVEAVLSEPRAVAAGPLTRFPDGTPQLSFGPDLSLATEREQRRLVVGLRQRESEVVAEVERAVASPGERDWVSGSCLLVSREAFDGVSGFDEGYFLYEEDADLCRRLRRAGGRVLQVPSAEVTHRLGSSMGRAGSRPRLEYHRSHLRYYRRWNGPLQTVLLRFRIAAEALSRLARGSLEEAGRLLRVALSP